MHKSLACLPVGVVVVLYHPASTHIERLYALAHEVRGVIVDNSENSVFDSSRVGKMEYLKMEHNYGIAKAQNVGIATLRNYKDIEYIVLLDQDSNYDSSFVMRLYDVFAISLVHNSRLATMGALIVDECSKLASSSLFHRYNCNNESICTVREIISSGSILRCDALAEIGLMDESLFIDFVDFEWCWRARSKGFLVARNAQVSLPHNVGRRTYRLFGYEIIISAPERYYYQYRNLLWLVRRNYVPLQWKLATTIKYALRLFYVPMLVGLSTYIHIFRGIRDGFRRCTTN